MISRRQFVQGISAGAAIAAVSTPASALATIVRVTSSDNAEPAPAPAQPQPQPKAGAVSPAIGCEVTDGGQYVTTMALTYPDTVKAEGIGIDTFTVSMTSTVDYGEAKGQPYAYFDASKPLEICKVDVSDNVVTLCFKKSQAPTLTWLAEGRNYPGILQFSIKENAPITLTGADGDYAFDGGYQFKSSYTTFDLGDAEVASFEDVQDTINYRLHKGTGDSLVVWFHGNGEGDFPVKDTNNNIAQLLGNRGGVAWATSEANEVFGNPYVMAFQAPNMWYFAVKDNLIEPCTTEIKKVIDQYGIDPNKVYLSGCSAGGFMSTRMLIANPGLFKAAMICCPALDAANARTETDNACPTDEELATLKDSGTAIWLVQGETDSSVDPELCSKRIWNIITAGTEISEATFEGTAGIASNFTTYETADNRFKLSLYETCDLDEVTGISGEKRQGGKLKFAEDYDLDGELEEVKYSDHWSWVYVLRNNPQAADGTHIWQWAASVK